MTAPFSNIPAPDLPATHQPEGSPALAVHRHLPALLVLLISLAASTYVVHLLQERFRENLRDHFAFRAAEITNGIQKRMVAYKQILRGSAGLFVASEQVSRAEWQRYVQSLALDREYPGIQGVGFALRIPSQELAAHTRKIRAEGFPNYAVWPAGARPEYTSIIYLEPFVGRNLRAFGYDMFSEPVRHKAMVRAMDSGSDAMSGKVKLVQETGQDPQAGFLIYLPIYRNGAPIQTIAERRAALLGWVYSPFRAKDLMLGTIGEELHDVRLQIYDGATDDPQALLYDSQAGLRNSEIEAGAPLFAMEKAFDFGGHRWTLRYTALPDFSQTLRYQQPWMGIAAILISALLFAITWSLSNTRYRAQVMAENLTASLRESEAKFRQFIERSPVAVALTSGNEITYLNRRFVETFGYTLQDIPNLDAWWPRAYPDERYRREVMENWRKQVEVARREGREVESGEYQVTCKNGAVRMVEIYDTPIGELDLVVFNDITEHKLAEQALRQLHERSREQAIRDALTGLYNRRYLDEILDRELARAERQNRPVSVVMGDIDLFKRLNDTYGHQAGDEMLKALGDLLGHHARSGDILCRYGGEEFLLLLPDMALKDARERAEQWREAFAQLRIPFGASTLQATISFGVAVYPDHGRTRDELIAAADQALYTAKKNGRNRVELYQPLMNDAS